MDTSRRHAAVIAWSIAVGVLYGAVGIGTSASAGADEPRPRPSIGADNDAAGVDGPGKGPGPRRHGRHNRWTPSGDGGGGSTDGGAPHDPCPWWPRPAPPYGPIIDGDSGGNRWPIAPVVFPAAPVAVFGDKAEPQLDIDTLPEDWPTLTPVAKALPTAPASVPYRPRAVTVPAAPRPPAPAAVRARPMSPPAVQTPPAAPVPPPQRPVAGVGPTAPVRLGYPDDLRDADLARVFSMALPGLAALAGMTALGGLVGYRQARAGYLLRAAGAARFVR